MRLPLLFILAMLWCTGCNTNSTAHVPENKTDTVVIVHRDTVVVIQQPAPAPVSKAADTTSRLPVKKPVEKKPQPLPVAVKVVPEDTVYHYYVNKKVSVKVTPWANDERWILLYNLYGQETYRQQDVRKSYTEFSELRFHDNGAVARMITTQNPGASQYWYETTVTFNTINEPEQRVSERKPYEDLRVNKPWEYWDKKTRQWRRQEVQE